MMFARTLTSTTATTSSSGHYHHAPLPTSHSPLTHSTRAHTHHWHHHYHHISIVASSPPPPTTTSHPPLEYSLTRSLTRLARTLTSTTTHYRYHHIIIVASLPPPPPPIHAPTHFPLHPFTYYHHHHTFTTYSCACKPCCSRLCRLRAISALASSGLRYSRLCRLRAISVSQAAGFVGSGQFLSRKQRAL